MMNNITDAAEEPWRGKQYAFFSHKECEAFPCHDTDDEAKFNCLFCYCPLYFLGSDCGGEYQYLTNGVKDCSPCAMPHERCNYGLVTGRFQEIVQKMKEIMLAERDL